MKFFHSFVERRPNLQGLRIFTFSTVFCFQRLLPLACSARLPRSSFDPTLQAATGANDRGSHRQSTIKRVLKKVPKRKGGERSGPETRYRIIPPKSFGPAEGAEIVLDYGRSPSVVTALPSSTFSASISRQKAVTASPSSCAACQNRGWRCHCAVQRGRQRERKGVSMLRPLLSMIKAFCRRRRLRGTKKRTLVRQRPLSDVKKILKEHWRQPLMVQLNHFKSSINPNLARGYQRVLLLHVGSVWIEFLKKKAMTTHEFDA